VPAAAGVEQESRRVRGEPAKGTWRQGDHRCLPFSINCMLAF
jgi:hypothetical protein